MSGGSRSRHGKKATNDWAASCCWAPIRLPPKTTSPEADARCGCAAVFVGRVGLSRVHASTAQHSQPLSVARPLTAPHQRRRSRSRVGLSPTDFLSHCKKQLEIASLAPHGLLEYVLRAAINVEHVGKPCDRSSTSRSISGRGRVVSLCSRLTGMDHGYISYMDASNGVP